ncbi:MAG: HAMP domain-containing histidine kinase [Clostridiales bacterium]|nr:HAMP domain-containing histidine kinase [Clostridiales bacterium]
MSEQAMIVLIVLLTVVSLALAFILISLLSQMRSIRSQVHFISRNETRKRLTFYGKSRSFRRLASDINEILDSYDERHEKILREDKEIKDTLTNMSHDIRTPLTSLKGYFELLEQTDDPEERRKYSSIITGRIDSLSEILETMFLYTKVSNVNFKISIDPIECSKIILETLFEYYDDFHDKGFEVDVDVDDGIRILGNEQSLKRIMQNLIRNSLVHGGGDVKLSVKRDEQGKKVVITLDNLLLEGQNPDPQKVFDRYYKGDASRHTGSSGVGLSVVKKLVESMSGDISAVVSDGRFKIAMSFKTI